MFNKLKLNIMKYSYYYISYLSGVMELGGIFWGLSKGYEMPYIICLVFAYQMGNIVYYFLPINIEQRPHIFLALAMFCCILSGLINTCTLSFVMEITTLFIGSTFLQLVREAYKIKVVEWEKWKKRTCRVIGFFSSCVISSNCGTWIMAAIIASLFLLSIFAPTFSYNNWRKELFDSESDNVKICWSMITHQAHYFVYTYVLCVFVYNYYHSALLTAIWFVLNWIPYTVTEPLVKHLKIDKYYKQVSVLAHLFNSVVLIGVYVFISNNNILGAVLLWMLTGFGGGNIFCMKAAMKDHVEYSSDAWMFSEQIGHIVGMIICMTLVILKLPLATLIAASVFAFITIPIFMGTIEYHKRKREMKC